MTTKRIIFDASSVTPTSGVYCIGQGECLQLRAWNLGPAEEVVVELVRLSDSVMSQSEGSCAPVPASQASQILDVSPYAPCGYQQFLINATRNAIVIQAAGCYRFQLTPAALGTAVVEAIFSEGEGCAQMASECCCQPEIPWLGISTNACLTITPGGPAGHSPIFGLDACCLLQSLPANPNPVLTDRLVFLSGPDCFTATIDEVFSMAVVCDSLGEFGVGGVAAGDTLVALDVGENCKRIDAQDMVTAFETPWTGTSNNPNLTITPGGVNGHAPIFDYDLCADIQATPVCGCTPATGDLVLIVQGGNCVLATWPATDLCEQIGLLPLGGVLPDDRIPVREAGGACKYLTAGQFLSGVVFPLLAPDGDCTDPSYSFATDSTTGMFYDPASPVLPGNGPALVLGFADCNSRVDVGDIVRITAFNGDFIEVGASINASTSGSITLTAGVNINLAVVGELQVNGVPGALGEVLTSSGPGVPPTWVAPSVAAEPATQLVYGTGPGIASDPDLTYDAATGALWVNTIDGVTESIPASATPPVVAIFGVPSDGTAFGGPVNLTGGSITDTAGTGNEGGYVNLTGGEYFDNGGGGDGYGGTILARGGNADTGNGGWIQLFGGDSTVVGEGGRVEIIAGSATSGDGGGTFITGGNGDNTSGTGGNVNVTAGSGFVGGNVFLTAGQGVGGSDGVINLLFQTNSSLQLDSVSGSAGDVLTSNGAGTPPTWTAPAVASAPANEVVFGTGAGITSSPQMLFFPPSGTFLLFGGPSAAPGPITLSAASNTTAAGVGGGITLIAGTGATSGSGGALSLAAGEGGATGAGGTLQVNAGTGGAVGAGGAGIIEGGFGGLTSGAGGAITVRGGAAQTDGDGGAVNITGRAGLGTNRAGGNVTITAGARTGTGLAGVINLVIPATGELRVNGVAGTAGQVLTSNGALVAPTWQTIALPSGFGPVLGANGSCAAPTYSFTSSPDSGMFYDPAGVGSVIIGDDNCVDSIAIGASITVRTNSVTRHVYSNTGEWLIGGTAGTAGQGIVSNGAGTPPTWQALSVAVPLNQVPYGTGPGITSDVRFLRDIASGLFNVNASSGGGTYVRTTAQGADVTIQAVEISDGIGRTVFVRGGVGGADNGGQVLVQGGATTALNRFGGLATFKGGNAGLVFGNAGTGGNVLVEGGNGAAGGEGGTVQISPGPGAQLLGGTFLTRGNTAVGGGLYLPNANASPVLLLGNDGRSTYDVGQGAEVRSGSARPGGANIPNPVRLIIGASDTAGSRGQIQFMGSRATVSTAILPIASMTGFGDVVLAGFGNGTNGGENTAVPAAQTTGFVWLPRVAAMPTSVPAATNLAGGGFVFAIPTLVQIVDAATVRLWAYNPTGAAWQSVDLT